MAGKVYFTDMRANSHKSSLPKKLRNLFDMAQLSSLFQRDELVAVKIHFGEKGNMAYIHPVLVRQIVDKIKENKGKPFLIDTNTLYVGSRSNSVDHLQTALENGFSYASVNAPLIIADGIFGKNFVEVDINQKHFTCVKVASDIFSSPAVIVLSHVKGHIATGFGGALKNLGMGCSNRGGKQMMHSSLKPRLNWQKCKGCGTCLKWCPVEAISFKDKKAVIDYELCIGCGECTASCLHEAVKIQWESETSDLQERMVEFA
ncbi:MAG: 4Fe-4S ferredoxin, partial [Firmicutes bacterium HGW-Firmicutes-13]